MVPQSDYQQRRAAALANKARVEADLGRGHPPLPSPLSSDPAKRVEAKPLARAAPADILRAKSEDTRADFLARQAQARAYKARAEAERRGSGPVAAPPSKKPDTALSLEKVGASKAKTPTSDDLVKEFQERKRQAAENRKKAGLEVHFSLTVAFYHRLIFVAFAALFIRIFLCCRWVGMWM